MQVDEMPMPEIGPREVLVKVAYCGVCGTDVDAYVGKQPRGWTITYPFRMGHELAGTVMSRPARRCPQWRPATQWWRMGGSPAATATTAAAACGAPARTPAISPAAWPSMPPIRSPTW